LKTWGSFSKLLVLLSFLIFVGAPWALPTARAAGDLVFVHAQVASRAYNVLQYNRSTGEFVYVAENGDVAPFTALGNIPDLAPDSLSIISLDDDQGTMLLRHGPWASLIRPATNQVIAANIGPLEDEPGISTLQMHASPSASVLADYPQAEGVYLFTGETHIRNNETVTADELLLLFIVKKDGSVYWLPIRDDIPSGRYNVRVVNDHSFRLTTRARMRRYNAEKKEYEYFHEDLTAIVDMDTGNVTIAPGLKLMTEGSVRNNPQITSNAVKLFRRADGTLNSELGLALPHVSANELARTGSPIEGTARELALVDARIRVNQSRDMAARVRAALSVVRGQERAAETLARIASAMGTAPKFKVVMLAGPTGTGKTWTAELMARVIAPDSESPLYRMSFVEHREASFLNTLLYGSGPGYVGSESVSGLVAWLLANPERGALLFDEIEKGENEALQLLQTFLDRGEVTVPPHLVAALLRQYKDVDKNKWPRELRNQTNEGRNPNVTIILRLTPNHMVFLGSNAGAEIFHGAGQTGLQGHRLRSDQEFLSANARFTENVVKDSLRSRGYGDDLIGRVQHIVPFGLIVGNDFNAITRDRLREAETSIYREYLVRLNLTDDARAFLMEENYDPLNGARAVADNVEAWLRSQVVHALDEGKIAVGDSIDVTVVRGGRTESSLLQLRRQGQSEVLHQFTAGRPLPPRPVELLERARTRLLPILERRIIGHREEIRQVVDAIVAQLQEAVDNPDRAGRPVVIYMDSTPGIGKTEIAKAVAEALFDDVDSLSSVLMNQITTEQDFFNVLVRGLTKSARSRPDAMVALLDEFPRAGAGGYRQVIQNHMMSILDEGRLPSLVEGQQGVRLPPATIFIATGNLLESAFPGGEFMTNRQLHSAYRGLLRHPERLRGLFEEAFHAALRSRLGDPILLSPLSDEQISELRTRFFAEISRVPVLSGVQLELGASAVAFFEREYVPIRGARWVRINMEKYVRVPLVSLAARQGELLRGTRVTIEFDEATREMRAVVHGPAATDTAESTAQPTTQHVLARIPRGRTEYHPEAVARAAMKTSIHEIGHALVARVLFGEGAVEEISTFGGGDGGVTYLGTTMPDYSMYTTAASGPLKIAMMLGGHVAEALFTDGETGEGASQDFRMARAAAETMLLHGSTMNLAPFPMTRGPDGQPVLSERNRARLEDQQSALLKFGAEITKEVLLTNRELALELAQRLNDSPNMTMMKAEFEQLVRGRLVVPSAERIRALAGVDRFTKKVCNELLLPKQSLWQRFKSWLRGLLA
jgi:ATP-dependent Clp protease ATP-binding subunit ClpA